MNELKKMTNNLNKLLSIKGALPDDFLLKVVAHPDVQKFIKKNNISNSYEDSFSFGWSYTSARITQKEAMQYVNISILSDFRDWVQFYNVPYAQVGNRKLFRKSALDKAILQDEQQTLNFQQ